MKKRFSWLDYAIIILLISAFIFVFFHLIVEDTTINESTSFDSSTLNKVVENYLSYYRQGLIVNTTIHGYNSTNREPVILTGNIKWIDDNFGNSVKALIDSNGNEYIVGLYNQVPEADVYIDSMTLEVNGDKYQNITDIKANPKNITSINDLISGISSDVEITTIVSLDKLDIITVQKINNYLFQNNERISVKSSSVVNQLSIVRGTTQELSQINNILGDFEGITGEIRIRVYNSTDSDIEYIKNNFDVIDVDKF